MSSDKTSDGFAFLCDECKVTTWNPPKLGRGSAPRDFRESWESAKEDGWRCYKNETGTFVHLCPEC